MIGKIHLLSVLMLCFGIVANASAQYCTSNAEIPPSTPAGRFSVNGDGTVTDRKTGLMWAQCAEGLSGSGCTAGSFASYTWQDALNLAEGKSLAGYGDWRLPNIKELQSIVEIQCNDPAINLAVFPNTPSSYFWSASPFSGNSDYAWSVHFYVGGAYYYSRDGSWLVRLVRSGQ